MSNKIYRVYMRDSDGHICDFGFYYNKNRATERYNQEDLELAEAKLYDTQVYIEEINIEDAESEE